MSDPVVSIYTLFLLAVFAAFSLPFLFKTGRWLVSMVRPDLIHDAWKPVQGQVIHTEITPDGWHVFLTYTASGQTFSVDGVIPLLRFRSGPPTHIALVYHEQDPSKWDWAEDRESVTVELQETRSTWFWLVLVGGLIGMIIVLGYHNPDILRRVAEYLP